MSVTISAKSMARIMRDKRSISMEPLISEGIYVLHDENDITISRVMMIGPEDTPYENGIYLFEMKFPENYPFSPLKAKFQTNNGSSRLHPNFYSNGKVCVSVIGTWTGPGWTSCQSLASVLVTFRSLMIENPLWQEPGFNGEKSKRNTDYNDIITYENLRIGIIQMLESPPSGFEGFLPIMREHFLQNYDWLVTKYTGMLNERSIEEETGNDVGPKYEGNMLLSPSIYNFSVKCQLTTLLEKMGELVISFQDESEFCYEGLSELIDKIPVNTSITYKKLVLETQESESIQRQFDVLLSLLQIRGQIQRVGVGKIIRITTKF